MTATNEMNIADSIEKGFEDGKHQRQILQIHSRIL